jgi:APA family basic amino acid/polyamine antiporter
LNLRIVAISTIVLLTLINIFGVKWGSLVMKICTSLKVLALILIVGTVFVAAKGSFSHVEPLFNWQPVEGKTLLAAIAAGIVGVLWSYDGWCDTTYIAGEIRDPQKNMSRVLISALLVVIVVYVMTNLAYMYTMPADTLKNSAGVAHDAMSISIGSGLATAITVAIMISVFGTTNGTILTGARVTYAMAQDKLAFGFFGQKHGSFQSPIIALVIQGVITCGLVAWNPKFEDLVGDFIFVMWIFYTVGAITIFIFRIKNPDLPRPYKTPLFPIVPLVFILFSLGMFINAIIQNPQATGLRLGIVAAGYPIYFVWKALATKQQSQGQPNA